MTQDTKLVLAGLALMAAGTTAGWNATQRTITVPTLALAPAAVHSSVALSTVASPSGPPMAATVSEPNRNRLHVGPFWRSATLPAGTPISVRVHTSLYSKTARAGQPWSGTVRAPVTRGDRVVIPAGSPVHGVVASSRPAERGSRAMLRLEVTSVGVRGHRVSARAMSGAVVAGSPRARNIGAIAGGTAAGALLGHAVGGGRGTLVGAVVGGGAATAAVATSHGYQVRIPAGSTMRFRTRSAVKVPV